jgi:hypothetical protein
MLAIKQRVPWKKPKMNDSVVCMTRSQIEVVR